MGKVQAAHARLLEVAGAGGRQYSSLEVYGDLGYNDGEQLVAHGRDFRTEVGVIGMEPELTTIAASVLLRVVVLGDEGGQPNLSLMTRLAWQSPAGAHASEAGLMFSAPRATLLDTRTEEKVQTLVEAKKLVDAHFVDEGRAGEEEEGFDEAWQALTDESGLFGADWRQSYTDGLHSERLDMLTGEFDGAAWRSAERTGVYHREAVRRARDTYPHLSMLSDTLFGVVRPETLPNIAEWVDGQLAAEHRP